MQSKQTGFAEGRAEQPSPRRGDYECHPRIAQRICMVSPRNDRVAIMHRGEIRTFESPEALFAAMQAAFALGSPDTAPAPPQPAPRRYSPDTLAILGVLAGLCSGLALIMIERVIS